MKHKVALALALATSPLALHAQQTGVSNPPDNAIEATPAETPLPKPSAAIPVQAAPAVAAPKPADEEFKPYVPLHPELKSHTAAADPDAGIVVDVPSSPNALSVGTQIRMRLNAALSTQTTQPNTPFTATLDEAVMKDGRVILPQGATVEGDITQSRGGRRISGTAMLHLQVRNVVMPDGTRMPLRASVIDTDQFQNTRIDSEGNILRKDHAGATLATMSLTTGSAAAAGAVIGGGVGALVGAGIGAGISTVVWLKQDRQAQLPEGSLIVLTLTEPMEITPLAKGADFSAMPAPAAGAMTSTATPPPAAYKPQQAFVPTN